MDSGSQQEGELWRLYCLRLEAKGALPPSTYPTDTSASVPEDPPAPVPGPENENSSENSNVGIKVLPGSDSSVGGSQSFSRRGGPPDGPSSLHQPLLPTSNSLSQSQSQSQHPTLRQRPNINKLLQASPSGRLVLSQWEVTSPRVNNEDSLRGYSGLGRDRSISRSVGRSIGRSVGRSAGRSVRIGAGESSMGGRGDTSVAQGGKEGGGDSSPVPALEPPPDIYNSDLSLQLK